MHLVVTGVAGFIGSSIAELALASGHTVLGIDCLTDYYDVELKKQNLSRLLGHTSFEFKNIDLAACIEPNLLEGYDVVLHQAGQPGVRDSWDSFDGYVRNNITATHQLLQACKAARIARIVYASSSSIYGNSQTYPVLESAVPSPFSPYGVSKLAAEHLVCAYSANFGLEAVCLRYFTVYGPRQRPDMAIQRILTAAFQGSTFNVLGDGTQIRDFTYVGDVARANILASQCTLSSSSAIVNISGGSQISLNDLINAASDVSGRPIELLRMPNQVGDVRRTDGSTAKASELLQWTAEVSLIDGLRKQWQYITESDISVSP